MGVGGYYARKFRRTFSKVLQSAAVVNRNLRGHWGKPKFRQSQSLALRKGVSKSAKTNRSRTRTSRKLRRSTTSGASLDPDSLLVAPVSMTIRKGRFSKSLTKFEYLQENSGTLQAGLGQQGVGIVAGHNTISQLFNSTAVSATHPNYFESSTALFDLNPSQANTGGGTFASTIRPNQDRLNCHYVKNDLQFTNSSNVPCTVQLIWLVPKKPTKTNLAPDNVWIDLLSQRALGVGSSSNSTENAGTVTAGNVGTTTYSTNGESPLTLHEFHKMYRVLKTRSYSMSPLHTQRVPYVVHFNTVYDKAIIQEANSVSQMGVVNASVFVMMIVRGTPVHTTTAAFAANVAITTSDNLIIWTTVSKGMYSAPVSRPQEINRSYPGFVGSVAGGDVEMTAAFNTIAKVAEINP